MFFEYSYRNAAGGLVSDTIESADRASAFNMLKAKGITVVSMKEVHAPRRTTGTANAPKVSPSLLRGLIGGGAVVAAALLAWWCIVDTRPSEKPEAKNSRPAVGSENPAAKLDQKATAGGKGPTMPQKEEPLAQPVANLPETATNETLVATNNVIAIRTNELSSVHRNATEQLLMWVFMTPLGNMPPPLPKLPKCDEKRMWEILSSPIPVKDGDTALQAEAKQMIEAAKKELKEYLRKGGDINEFFNYYHGQLKLAHMQRQESQRSVIKACRDEDPEVARAYVEKVNKDLEEKGIRPVIIPPKFKEKLGLE